LDAEAEKKLEEEALQEAQEDKKE